MTTPGSNTLRMALSIQGKQAISYRSFLSRSVNANGNYVSAFNDPVTIYGSVQPLQRSLYQQLGLDFQKNYVTLYVTKSVADVKRGTSGDQFDFNGRTWQLLSNLDWFAVDGWSGVLCVEVTGE